MQQRAIVTLIKCTAREYSGAAIPYHKWQEGRSVCI